MKTKLLILIAIPILFYACKKDTYTTKPQISIKSLSRTTLSSGDLLTMEIEFTDKEGDIQDTLWVQKFSKVCPTTPGVEFVRGYRIPNFPATKDLKGIIEIGFGYNAFVDAYIPISGCGIKNDTCYFKMWLTDRDDNSSDTITSPDIVLLR